MKTKGISIWEQHIERIVLALAVLVFIGFTAMQFVGDPNSTEVAGRKFTPADVDAQLQTEAERIRVHYENGAAPSIEIDVDALPQVSEEFRTRLAGTISPGPTVAQFQPALPLDGGGVAVTVGKPFAVPKLTAPGTPIARQYFDALGPGVLEQFSELDTVAMAQTGDIDWVTAAAVFDLGAVMDAFRFEGPDGQPAQIPSSWYNDRVSVLDVVIEREELVDGAWANATTIEPAPGQFSVRPVLGEDLDAPTALGIEEQVNEDSIRTQIMQPEFYSTKNESWTPPDPREMGDDLASLDVGDEGDEQAAVMRSLQKQLTTKNKRRGEVNRKLEQFGGPLDDPSRTRPPAGRDRDAGGDSGGGRKAPGGGGTLGAGGGTRGGAEEQENKENERVRIRLTRQLATLDEQIDRLQARLAGIVGADAAVEESAPEQEDKGFGEVLVWGHDLMTEPGRSYRYRLRVVVYNPFFAKKPNLVEAQHDLAKSISLTSAASEWSEAIEVQPPLRVFITRAHAIGQRNPGDLGLGAATAEVYRFHDGRWWQQRFTVQPGDRIGAVRDERGRGEEGSDNTSIDYSTEWFLLDVVAHLKTTSRDVGEGKGAWTLLQNLRTGALSPARDPRLETRMAERLRLKEQVDLAEL